METKYTAMPNLTVIRKVSIEDKDFYIIRFDADLPELRELYGEYVYGTVEAQYVINERRLSMTKSFNMAELNADKTEEGTINRCTKMEIVRRWKAEHPGYTDAEFMTYVMGVYGF